MSFNYRFYNSVAGKNTTTSAEGGHVQKIWGLGESAWLVTSIYEFVSHTFFSSNKGHDGPTLSTCRNNYNTTWDDDPLFFNMTINGIQRWTVPSSADYTFVLTGATGGIHGGSYYPGFPGAGAVVTFTIFLIQETILNLVVGQCPTSTTSSSGNGSAGGGGSFVYQDDLTLIGVAGGGGGAGHGQASDKAGIGRGGSSTEDSNENNGHWQSNGSPNVRWSGGTEMNNGMTLGGNGSTVGSYNGAGGGAGWNGKGDDCVGGYTTNTGKGGESRTGNWVGGASEDGTAMYGGFGGGGGSGGNGNAGGGAGGYTGGGAGDGWMSVNSGANSWGGGAGGGSYCHPSATNISKVAGSHGINYTSVENGTIQIMKL